MSSFKETERPYSISALNINPIQYQPSISTLFNISPHRKALFNISPQYQPYSISALNINPVQYQPSQKGPVQYQPSLYLVSEKWNVSSWTLINHMYYFRSDFFLECSMGQVIQMCDPNSNENENFVQSTRWSLHQNRNLGFWRSTTSVKSYKCRFHHKDFSTSFPILIHISAEKFNPQTLHW